MTVSPQFKDRTRTEEVKVGGLWLPGILSRPPDAASLVVFAHGSGSSRFSARNRQVAAALNHAGMATLLFDLLDLEEEMAHGRANVFDIPLLSRRLTDAVEWAQDFAAGTERVGLFGASTGGAAALTTAAELGMRIGAVVSRGARPDLAGDALEKVASPTLLIVGGNDHGVVELNQYAFDRLKTVGRLEIVPGATHLFPEPGAMERVTKLAAGWFERYFGIRQ
jgi:dienelactone hydrolase